VLNGRKSYCTGALFADWGPVVARGQDDQNYLAFVPSDAPGLKVTNDWDGMGQKVTASSTVELDHVHVPAAHMVPHYQLFTGPATLAGTFPPRHTAT